MPIVCRNIPRRKSRRHFTAKTAAQAVCSALDHGATESEMCLELRNCIECREDRRRSRQQQAQVALQALNGSNSTLQTLDVLVNGLEVAFRIVQTVSRFVPQARVPGLALIPVQRALVAVAAEIRVARAANDAAIAALRIAA